MTRVTIGLLLPSREAVLWGGGEVASLVTRAERAETAGFDSVWLGESPLARPRADPLLTLAAIAARTDKVTLGTAILLPLLRHPFGLAHAAATLDRLAGGRLILGVGPGAEVPATYTELAAFAVPSSGRVGRLLHTVETCRRLWVGDDAEIDLQPQSARPGGPPVWIAAQGPRLLELTGTSFDGWLPFSPTTADYAAGLDAVSVSAHRAGRTVTPGAYLTAAIDPDASAAQRELDRYMQAYYGLPAEAMAVVQAARAGSVAEIVEWIVSYVDAGARHLVLRLARIDPGGYDEAAASLLDSLRRALGSTAGCE